MVEISKIVDQVSLESWLKTRPNEDTFIIAHRAALRVLPLAWQWFVSDATGRKREPLYLLRCSLTSGVVCYAGTPEIIAVADAAQNAINTLGNIPFSAGAGVMSAYYAADTILGPSTESESNAASYAANAVSSSIEAIANAASAGGMDGSDDDGYFYAWKRVNEDLGLLQDGVDLLSETLYSEAHSDDLRVWQDLKPVLQSRSQGSEATARGVPDINWSFWIDWYERALKGTETRWDMLTEIAMIEDEVWQGAPPVLMEQIYSIQRKYAQSASYNAEVVREDPEDQLIEAVPETDLPEDVHQDARERVEHAMEQLRKAMATSNLLYALAPLLEELETCLEKYADTPVRLYEEYLSIAGGIATEVKKDADLGDERPVQKLDEYLRKGAMEILASDENVQRRFDLSHKARLTSQPMPSADKMRQMTDTLVADTKPKLADEMRADEAIILDEAAPTEKRRNAIYRYGSRAIRIASIAWKKTAEAGDQVAKVGAGAGAIGGGYWFITTYVLPWFA